MAFKINPITGKFNLWKSDKPSSWNANSNANDYTETGVYHFAGLRLNAQDNLPIDNVGENTNIAFTLIVDRVNGYYNETDTTINDIPGIISQTIFLGNRQGSETRVYVRNGNIQYSDTDSEGEITWETWRELTQTTYLGVIQTVGYGLEGYNANEVLRGCTENGIYTGAFMVPPQIFDIFKLEVMNNYAMAQVYNVANTVLQTLTILTTSGNSAIPIEGNGAHATLQRKGTWNGSAYEWTKWENQSFEIPTATNTTLGVVKGGGNVNVGEDGTLSVDMEDVQTAAGDKAGIVKQGRNVLIDSQGAINVDGVSSIERDSDLNDGELNDIIVKYEPTKKLEDLQHTYNDVVEEGTSDYIITRINVPDLYPSGNDMQLIGVHYFDDDSQDILDLEKTYYEPNSSAFAKSPYQNGILGYRATSQSIKNIWGTAAGIALSTINGLRADGYGNPDDGAALYLGTGFGQQPYMAGHFVFILNEEVRSNCSMTHRLYNAQDEYLGTFADESGDKVLRISSIRGDGQHHGWEKYLPLYIKTEYFKGNADVQVSEPTSGDFAITRIEIRTEEITNGLGDWSNPIINSTGRCMRVVAEKWVDYPSTIQTYDHTRCIAIGKDGISIQSVNSSHEQKQLYIKVDADGNIVTNIGEFITS